jgi:mRNA-degrading endonuclease RelE of RelBE toxin-antitoxin system
MAKKQTFLAAEWSEQWKASYVDLSTDRQAACDKAAIGLIKQLSSPGLHIKPIHPDKYYSEARLNSGDRVIFRVEEGTIFFVDIVKHDDIDRYGKRPRKQP